MGTINAFVLIFHILFNQSHDIVVNLEQRFTTKTKPASSIYLCTVFSTTFPIRSYKQAVCI